MPYRRVLDRLDREGEGNAIVSLPDGSVDRYSRVVEGRSRRIASRDAFGERIAAGHADSFRLDRVARDPGGQAVNMARQTHALGDDVSLFGHLDHPLLDSFPFEATSMGEPACVNVLVFDDAELTIADPSTDLLEWTPDDLERIGALDALELADAICCGNWVSTPGMDDFLEASSDLLSPETTVVFDPGSLTGSDPDALGSLVSSLSELAGEHRAVLSANADEMSALLDRAGIAGRNESDRLRTLRDRTGLDAVLIHARERALAATADGPVAVPNLDQRAIRRRTGAGDRFNGGLAHALAASWKWDAALALGNACASYYVANEDSGARSDLADSLRDHSLPG